MKSAVLMSKPNFARKICKFENYNKSILPTTKVRAAPPNRSSRRGHHALSILQVLLVGAKESIILCHLVSGKQENSDSTVGKSSGISQSEDIIGTIDEIYNKLVALV